MGDMKCHKSLCNEDLDTLKCFYHLGLNTTLWPPCRINDILSWVPLWPTSAFRIWAFAISFKMGPISGALSGTILLWVTHEAANIQGEVSNILSHWILKIENVQLLKGVCVQIPSECISGGRGFLWPRKVIRTHINECKYSSDYSMGLKMLPDP